MDEKIHTIGDAIDAYLTRIQNDQTRSNYETALGHLPVDGDLPLAELSPDSLVDMREQIAHLAQGTINTYMSPARKLFRFLVLRGLVQFTITDLERAIDICKDMSNGRAPVTLPKVPPEKNVQAVIQAAIKARDHAEYTDRQHAIAVRNLAIIQALCSTAMRVGELCKMTVGDLLPEDKMVIIHGKGNRERIGLFTEDAWGALQDWLSEHPDLHDDAPVFVRMDRRITSDDMPMSTASIRDIIAMLARDAGVKKFTPHNLRHRAGTRFLSQTGDLASTQDLLGHASPQTTRRYAKIATSRLRKLHSQVTL